MRVTVTITAEQVDGGFQPVASFSDGRPEIRGAVQTKEDCLDLISIAGEKIALVILRAIADGEDATLTISRGKAAA